MHSRNGRRSACGGDLFTREGELPEASSFARRSEGDRHQFRIIVSPEDGQDLGELKETTRALMSRMEKDLGTRLDWVAVDHHIQGHPHTHIVMRGKDPRGADLVIAPEYISSGIRKRAAEIVTETLGPRRDVEIARARHAEIGRDRLTGIDRALMADIQGGQIDLGQPAGSEAGRFDRSLKRQRLVHLEGRGLATETAAGRWQLKPGWTDTRSGLDRRVQSAGPPAGPGQ